MVKMCKSVRGSNLKLSKCCWMLIQLCAAERIWSPLPVLCARHRSPHLHYYSHLHYDLTRLCVTSWPGRILQFGHRYCGEYTVFGDGANNAIFLLEVPKILQVPTTFTQTILTRIFCKEMLAIHLGPQFGPIFQFSYCQTYGQVIDVTNHGKW